MLAPPLPSLCDETANGLVNTNSLAKRVIIISIIMYYHRRSTYTVAITAQSPGQDSGDPEHAGLDTRNITKQSYGVYLGCTYIRRHTIVHTTYSDRIPISVTTHNQLQLGPNSLAGI